MISPRSDDVAGPRLRGRLSLAPEMLAGLIGGCDVCLIVTIAAVVSFLYKPTVHGTVDRYDYLLTSLLGAILFVAAFQKGEGYALSKLSDYHWQLIRITTIWAVVVSMLLLVAFVTKVSAAYSRGWALIWIAATPAFVLVQRGLVRLAIDCWVKPGYIARNIAVVCARGAGQRLVARLERPNDKSIRVHGVFDLLGNTGDLVQFVREHAVDEVIIALPTVVDPRLTAIVNDLKVLPVDLRLSADSLFENLSLRGQSYLDGVPLLTISDRPIRHWNAVAKWIEDTLVSALLLIVLAPLMGVVAALVKLDSRGPVLFAQERFGFNDHEFKVLKFRTMYVDRSDASGARRTARSDPRVTRVGRVLRRLSLDELPQLVNVLRGDMSLVGPRPHVAAMRAGNQRYSDAIKAYSRRHRVKPGITGWAQVHGCRGEVDTMEKAHARFEHDLYYIENWSLWLDLKTLFLTVPLLLAPQNAY
jgi:Undecaprenyl-phosphate glucose phosphotransferase